MKAKKIFLIIALMFSIHLGITSIVTYFLPITQQHLYVDKNNVTFHLNEDNVLTDIEIVVANPTNHTYTNQKVVLRVVDKNNYPELYTSPIFVSLNAYETKTIKVSNFRNSIIFSDEYTITSDTESDILVKEKTFEESYKNLKIIFAVLCFTIFIVCLNVLVRTSKNKKGSLWF